MTQSSTDRTARFLEDAHDRLAAFARESYELHGRGVTRVTVPDVPSGTRHAFVSTDIECPYVEVRPRPPAGAAAARKCRAEARTGGRARRAPHADRSGRRVPAIGPRGVGVCTV